MFVGGNSRGPQQLSGRRRGRVSAGTLGYVVADLSGRARLEMVN
jgi:hypothetical protein